MVFLSFIGDIWEGSLWLRTIVGIAILIGIIACWDTIMEYIIAPIVKFVISLLSLLSLILLIGGPIAIILLFWGENIYNAMTDSFLGNIGGYILLGIVGLALLALLIFFIIASFSDEGRAGYLQGVKKNVENLNRRRAQEARERADWEDRNDTSYYNRCKYCDGNVCQIDHHYCHYDGNVNKCRR